MSEDVGRVIGTKGAQPLEFWLAVNDDDYVQLDEVVAVTTVLPKRIADGRDQLDHYGVVDQIESAYEGASFHSDVFRAEDGTLPVDVSTIAHVAVTRVSMHDVEPETEILVPPKPGRLVRRATPQDRELALYFDKMHDDKGDYRFPAGLSRDGLPVYGNLQFLDGTRGAHINISGISGVATKTSYALFLLYGLFNSDVLPREAQTHAIIFNVKGGDLLWLDKPNSALSDPERKKYADLGLPAKPFSDVGFWAPAQDGDFVLPNTGSRTEGVLTYYWTIREFCRQRLLRFLFADADDESSQLSFVVGRVEGTLADWARASDRLEPNGKDLIVNGLKYPSLADLAIELEQSGPEFVGLNASAVQTNQWHAFMRRFQAGVDGIRGLVRAETEKDAEEHHFDWAKHKVNVIDINRLTDRAKRFVVGVIVKRLMDQKDKESKKYPLVFLVLDELNKYAPRDGRSPIKEVLLDIAERGRSLGVVLIGAEQTASEIERRVTANASFRVTGRLDAAEAQREEYGFLRGSTRDRSSVLKPGTMFLQQPDIPVPLLVQFPFPAWATRSQEVGGERLSEAGALLRNLERTSGGR